MAANKKDTRTKHRVYITRLEYGYIDVLATSNEEALQLAERQNEAVGATWGDEFLMFNHSSNPKPAPTIQQIWDEFEAKEKQQKAHTLEITNHNPE